MSLKKFNPYLMIDDGRCIVEEGLGMHVAVKPPTESEKGENIG